MNKKRTGFNSFYVFALILACLLIVFMFVNVGNNAKEYEPSSVITMIEDGKVENIYAYNGEAKILLKSDYSKLTEEQRKAFPRYIDGYFEYTSVSWERILTAIEDYNTGKTEEEKIVWSNPPVRASWIESAMPIIYIVYHLLLYLQDLHA